MSPAAFLEKTIKKLFWNVLAPGASDVGSFRFKPGMSVLALRPDRLGDFILTTPALQLLEKKMGSKGRLTLVAGERNEALARFFFPRAEILVFRKSFLKRLALFFRLRSRRFDLVIDFHSYPFSTTSALLALGPKCPARIGFWDDGKSKDVSRRVFNLGVSPPAENLHERDKSLYLLNPLMVGRLKGEKVGFKIPALGVEIRNQVKAFYNRIDVGPTDFLLAIHPTLQKADNRWSLEKYAELAQKMSSLPRLKILVVHGLGEEDGLQRFKGLCAGLPNLFILPDEDVLFILEAAKRFDLFVCNDSGLMHLADLVTKVLAVFGPSEPVRWGPLKRGNSASKVFRSKDHLCDSVKVSLVTAAVERACRRHQP